MVVSPSPLFAGIRPKVLSGNFSLIDSEYGSGFIRLRVDVVQGRD